MLQQAHFFPLPAQGNIYTNSVVKYKNGKNKLLVGTLNREVYCFEYLEDQKDNLVPTVKPIHFDYLPNAAEIISMDVYSRSADDDDFLIGITIIKKNNETNISDTTLIIYSDHQRNEDNETIAQNKYSVTLDHVPYQLTNFEIVEWFDGNCTISHSFCLSGSDYKLHFYKEHTKDYFEEMDAESIFPNFINPSSIIFWTDLKYLKNYEECLLAFGCESGYLRFTHYNLKECVIVRNYSTELSSFVVSMKFFADKNQRAENFEEFLQGSNYSERPKINILATNSTIPSIVFSDVISNGLSKYTFLPKKSNSDVVTSSAIGDINFDGNNEILVGNSFEEVRIFDQKGKLLQTIQMVSPIFGIDYVDLTNDGIRELIVYTMKGVYIYQHNHKEILRIIKEKLDRITIPSIKDK